MSKKETSNSLRLLVKTSIVIFFTVIISKLFSYLYKVVIARSFGPELYGTYSIAIIVLGLFASIAMLGFPEGITRFVSYYRGKKQESKIKHTIRFSLLVLVLCSIIAGLILFLSSRVISIDLFKNESLIYFLKVLSISLPFSVIFTVIISYLRAIGKIKSYAMLSSPIQNGLKLGILLALIFFSLGEKSVALSQTIGMMILTLISYLIARKSLISLFRKKDLKGKEKKIIEKELFYYSWPLIFVGLLYGLFYWTDSLVLGYFLDAKVVGLYNAAVTLVSLFAIAQDLFIQLLLPLLTTKYAENKTQVIRDTTKQVMKWVFMINILIFAALILFPGVIINLLFGADYILAQPALRILSFGALFSGFLGLFLTLLSIKGKTKTILVDYIIFTIFNFVLDVILVKTYGISGAAMATSITWILFMFVVLLQIKKSYGFFPIKRDILKITAIAGILVIIAYIVQDYFVATLPVIILFGLIFLIIYILVLFLTKSFDKEDLSILRSIKDKILNYKKN